MKYYIIAGEASGDMHAANLMKELKKLDASAQFRCWGGDKMKEQGAELVKHYRDLAFMGFTEVLMNLKTILRNIDFCKKDILSYKPDVVILVDYPGFNLRIAEFAKTNGFKVFYYISPQVWAWKESRVNKIRRFVDRMFVILPFEKDFYKKHNYEVDFVGHPLLDALDPTSAAADKNPYSGKPVIALLPGSRKQEIAVKLPLMLSVIDEFKDHQFIIAGAPSVPEAFYKEIIGNKNVSIVFNQTHELLMDAYAALVTSGTATLETALFEVPEVVCYKGGKVSYYIARSLVNVKYISLVNLIMDKEIVKELIQNDLTTKNITEELKKIVYDQNKRAEMKNNFLQLKEKLGGKGASARTASLMFAALKK